MNSADLKSTFRPAKPRIRALIFFTASLLISGFLVSPLQAQEDPSFISSSEIFQPGTVRLSLNPYTFHILSVLGSALGPSEPGVHHNIISYDSDYSEDEHVTVAQLGSSLGIFMAPRFLFQFIFNLDIMNMELCFWECDDSGNETYRAYTLGGGFSFFQPLSPRTFLDIGTEMKTIIYKGEGSSDSDAGIGMHLSLGGLLTKELSIGFGFYYENYMDSDIDIIGFRTNISFFFPTKLFKFDQAGSN